METKAKYTNKKKSKRLTKLNTNSFTLDLLDFELGVSKQIAPYKCNACEAVFKRLSGYAIHNRYYANTSKCPKDIDLVRLNMRQTKHQANGNQYEVWELIPPTKPTGIKDELLLEMESIAFPNFNAITK
jgi:hypothetical protein